MKFKPANWVDNLRRRSGLLTFRQRRAAHLRLGRRGERLAARLLAELGLELLVRNYTDKQGEIDLVARDGEVLCFVEVKTRHRAVYSRPADAVRGGKRLNLVRTAHRYLREIGRPPVPYRFDIVEVILDGFRLRDMRYHRNAFTEAEIRRRPADVFPVPMD